VSRPRVLRGFGGRAGLALVVLAVLSAVVFFGTAALPGDAASQALGAASPEAVAELRARWGLDRPVVLRYLDWLTGLVRGDLGTSTVSGRPVAELLTVPLQRTATLAAVAVVGIVLVGVVGGTLTGSAPTGVRDRVGSTASLLAVSVPEFVLGSGAVVLFAGVLHWFPAVSLVPVGGSPWDDPQILVLPALVLTVVGGASLARIVRGIVAAESARPHVEAARSAGDPELVVLGRHLLPGVVGPVVQASAQLLPYVVGGTVVTERLFGYPGLGSLLVAQVAARDTPTVQAVALLVAVVVLLGLLFADLAETLHRRRFAS
jgi:peptide/nickel transport system permease protein